MSMNGQARKPGSSPRGKPFGSPDGPDPRESGARGGAERERRQLEKIGQTRERLVNHGVEAQASSAALENAAQPGIPPRVIGRRMLGPLNEPVEVVFGDKPGVGPKLNERGHRSHYVGSMFARECVPEAGK